MKLFIFACLFAISFAQTATCTCTFSADNDVDEIYIDGVDVSGSVTNWDQRSNWGTAKSISFQCDGSTRMAVKAVDGNGNPDGCGGGGFALYCESTDTSSIWHGLISDQSWKAWGGRCTDHSAGCNYNGEINYLENEPANWFANDFDDSSWQNADQGRTAYASSAIANCGTECEICVENTAGWLFRSPTGTPQGGSTGSQGDTCTARYWRLTATEGGTGGTGGLVDGHYCFGGYGSYGFAIYDATGTRILPQAVDCTECRSSYGDDALYGSFTNGQHWCVWSPDNDGRSVLTITFAEDVQPTEYKFDCGGSSNCIVGWTIEASSDGSNWNLVETQTDRPPNNPQEYTMNSCYAGSDSSSMSSTGDLLIMKLRAGSAVFDYESSYWTDDQTLNPGETTAMATDDIDAKLDEFNNTPISALKVCYEFLENCYIYHLDQEYESARALFSAGYINDPNFGGETDDVTAEEAKHGWTDLFIPPDDAQYDTFWNGGHGHGCDMQRPGINTQCNDGNWARIGYCVNLPDQGCQPADSEDADSAIGVGLKLQDYPIDSNAPFGQYALYVGNEYVDDHQKQAWIFIPGEGEVIVPYQEDTVLMKLRAGSDVFDYESSYWTDDQTLNPGETTPSNDDDIDAKMDAFNDTPLSELKVCFRTLENCYTYDLGQEYSSARELFSSGYLRDDSLGRGDDLTAEEAKHAWTDLYIAPGSSDYDGFWNGGHGHNCDMQKPGINTQCNDGNWARIGYCVNLPDQACQPDDSHDADSSIGIGLKTQNYPINVNAPFGEYLLHGIGDARLASDYFDQAWLLIPGSGGSQVYENCVANSSYIDSASIMSMNTTLIGDFVQLEIAYPGPMELIDISFAGGSDAMTVEDWTITETDGCTEDNFAMMTMSYDEFMNNVPITVEEGKEKFSIDTVFRYVTISETTNQAQYVEVDKTLWMSIDSPTSFVVGLDFALAEGSDLLFDAISHSASQIEGTDDYGIIVHFKTWVQESYEFNGDYAVSSQYFDSTLATLDATSTAQDYMQEESGQNGKLQMWMLTLQVPNDCMMGAHTETVHLDMTTTSGQVERIELNMRLSDEFRPECAKSIGEFQMDALVLIDGQLPGQDIQVFLYSVVQIDIKFNSMYTPDTSALSNIVMRQQGAEVCSDCLSLLEFECASCALTDGVTTSSSQEFNFTISLTPENFLATPQGIDTSMDLSFDFTYARRRLVSSGSKTPSLRVPLRMKVRDYDCHSPRGVLADLQHVQCGTGGTRTLVCGKNNWQEVSGCQVSNDAPTYTALYMSVLLFGFASVMLGAAVFITQREKLYATLPTQELAEEK